MTSLAYVEAAVRVLRDGGVIAMPTDTLYALAANGRDANAVRRVYEIKVREQGKPLPLFVSSLAMAETIGVFNATARTLAGQFWPGALTLVIQKQPSFESDALAGGSTVALRQPDNAVAQAVIEGLDAPVTATSANRSGGPDPVSADDVRSQLQEAIDMVIDTGPCVVGVSSTIVDCTGEVVRILRAGAISAGQIEAALASTQS